MIFKRSAIVKDVPIRDDQTWKCPNCFHTTHFRVPITEKEYNEEYKLRKGRYLSTPSFREDEKYRADIIKKLKQLGYLGFKP